MLVSIGGALVAGLSACRGAPEPPNTVDSPPCLPGEKCASTQKVVYSAVRPPPLSGGTMLIATDGKTALVSDPERDLVGVVDVTGPGPTFYPTTPNARPGRAAEDSSGRFHVVLREAGAILTIANGATTVTPVCPAPRGIAYASAVDSLYVACAGGELVRLTPAAAPSITATTMLGPDLRDVVASSTLLFVSHFRSAALDTVTFAGVLVKTRLPLGYETKPSPSTPLPRTFTPDVAWRLVARPGGGALMLHQQALSSPIDDSGNDVSGAPAGPPHPAGSSEYGGFDCESSLVHAQLTAFDATGEVDQSAGLGGLSTGLLPTDVGVSGDGNNLALIGTGQLSLKNTSDVIQSDGCAFPTGVSSDASGDRAVAAQFIAQGGVLVQYRQPSRLEIRASDGSILRVVSLGGDDRSDTGFELFHGSPDAPGLGIACASCHPEGGDDGHVWKFLVAGSRRTMSLASNVTERAPFHWKGDLPDLSTLVDEVFTRRMGGSPQSLVRKAVLESYIARFPASPIVAGLDTNAVARGKALFESQGTGCTTCHAGQQLTTKAFVDVGTGGPFKVPSLQGLGLRAPYLHDGSAATLTDRFGPSGGGDKHGHTSQLSAPQVSDLVAYLSSL